MDFSATVLLYSMCHFLNAAPPHSPKWCYQQWTPQTAIPFCNGAGGRLRLCSICRKESGGKKVWSTQNSKRSFIWSRHFCGGCEDICQPLMVQRSGNLVLHQNLRPRRWGAPETVLRWEMFLSMHVCCVTETNTSAVLTLKMRLQHRMQRVKVNFEYTFFANEHIMFSLSCIRTVSFCRCCCCTLRWFAASLHLYN